MTNTSPSYLLSDRILQVRKLNQVAKRREAEALLRSLFAEFSTSELHASIDDLTAAINDFFPKRRRDLSRELDKYLAPANAPSVATARAPVAIAHFFADHATLRRTLRAQLSELGDHHIFQWATFYRDAIDAISEQFARAARRSPNELEWAEVLREEFSRHGRTIFAKGYFHKIEHSIDREDAIFRSAHGLEKFLDLPIAYYLASLAVTKEVENVRISRTVCSAILSGIIQGFGETDFETNTGWQILPRDGVTRRWAHYVPFLRHDHMRTLIDHLEQGEFSAGLQSNVLPIIEALDKLFTHPQLYLAPVIGQYIQERRGRRLDILLVAPDASDSGARIEVQCYLSNVDVNRYRLEESANRGAALVIAPLRIDLQDWIDTHDLLRRLVVNSTPLADNSGGAVASLAYDRLAHEAAERRRIVAGAVLTYNPARDFPLEKAAWRKFFFVNRPSVRDLLRSFERSTGIHLWCSVRRSGKTTAGFELASSTGTAVVVSQTCDTTGERHDDNAFYRRFTKALDSGQRISDTFFYDAIAACLPDKEAVLGKVIFVLDEYETIFGQLKIAAAHDGMLRYKIVQPMLNQMVNFSRENLLVLIGMRPNAHYIVMDQNQFSPCVEQDQFPLFFHNADTVTSEFRHLLQRAVANRAEIDPAFANAMYAETGGHPYLTVNLLVEFFDWLIETKASSSSLRLKGEDFHLFNHSKLAAAALRESGAYDVMRHFVRGALVERNRKTEPWLYAVMTTLRQVARDAPESLCISRNQARDMVRRLQLERYGIEDADDLLRTAAQANFFALEGDFLRPRIPLLARLAGVTNSPVII